MGRMVKWRYGLTPWVRYIKNKWLGLFLLRQMPSADYEVKDNFEVHILSPKSGLWMAYWTIRSFIYYSALRPKIVLHDDGTIDLKTAKMFEKKLPNVEVLLLEDANRLFDSNPNIPNLIKEYRRGTNKLILMFVDHFFLSSSDVVLVLDNDLIFYNTPTEIIDFVRGRREVDAIYSAYEDTGNIFDLDNGYLEKHKEILSDAEKLNSGLMIFDKSKIGAEPVIEYFEHTTNPDGYFIEQSGWGLVLSQKPHAFFSSDRYRVKGGFGGSVVMKHFTNPRRHEMFAQGIDEVRKRMSV